MTDELLCVILDLDDTLYPQSDYLSGAMDRVAEVAASLGADGSHLRSALDAALCDGSDSGDVIGTALRLAAIEEIDVSVLVEAFRSYVPSRLEPYPGVRETLSKLKERVPLALVSDGDVPGQKAKLEATGLTGLFSVLVFTDAMGRQFRKPDPAGVRRALELLSSPPDRAIVIGDRPDKDVAAAMAAGVRAIRLLTGEYASRPDLPGTFATVASLAEAAELLSPLLPRVGAR